MARPSKLRLHNPEPSGDLLTDFMERVFPEPMSGCWLWIGDCQARGYGRIRGELAHRVSHELFVGRIPEGLVIDHKCKTLCCVNPDHLEAVTQGTNVRRGDAAKIQKTHCDFGHPLEQRNGKGQRICKECMNRRKREHRAREKAKR